MFRPTILPIFRSIRLCNTACGMLYPIRCRSVIWWRSSSVTGSPTGNKLGTTYQKLYCTVYSSWRWAKLLPETCRAKLDLSINRYCCTQLAFFFTTHTARLHVQRIQKNVSTPPSTSSPDLAPSDYHLLDFIQYQRQGQLCRCSVAGSSWRLLNDGKSEAIWMRRIQCTYLTDIHTLAWIRN